MQSTTTEAERVPIFELGAASDKITEQLKRDGQLVITDKDRPVAVMLKVDDSTFEDTMLDLSRVQALRALKAAQENSVKNGLCNITLDEINATITATRAERRAREKSR